MKRSNRLTNRSKSKSLDKRFEELNCAIRGWVNYFRISKMKIFLKETDKHLRARIRMIIWKQWKKPKTQIKNLMKCGYSIDEERGLAFGCAKLEHLQKLFGEKNNNFKSIFSGNMISKKGNVFVHNTKSIDDKMLIALDILCKYKNSLRNNLVINITGNFFVL